MPNKIFPTYAMITGHFKKYIQFSENKDKLKNIFNPSKHVLDKHFKKVVDLSFTWRI
jgi:hypothetical protein